MFFYLLIQKLINADVSHNIETVKRVFLYVKVLRFILYLRLIVESGKSNSKAPWEKCNHFYLEPKQYYDTDTDFQQNKTEFIEVSTYH